MRKLITCPKCGRANPQKRSTCSACSEELPSPTDKSTPQIDREVFTPCAACGKLGEAGLKVCPKCGFQLEVESSNQHTESKVGRQGFYNQPVETTYNENIGETLADPRYEAAKVNPVARGETIRNVVLIASLLIALFFAARNCAYFTN